MRRALLVGIDNYPRVPLKGCVKDIKRVRELLIKHQDQDSSPNFDCEVLLSPEGKVTRPLLRNSLQKLFADKANVALFYFSGHGTRNNLGGYLVTQDTERYDEGVSMTEVLGLANNSRIDEVVIILDCCHSGSFGALPPLDNDSALLREGVSVLTASRDSQVAIETGDGGIFTSLICGALSGGAADVMGNVTVGSVYAYADQALGAWDQRPLFKSHVSKFIPLRKCQPTIELPILRLLLEYFPSPSYEFPLDPSYEPDVEPDNTKNERIFSHLQNYRDGRLLVPVSAKHLYFAAINSKACKLTPLGQYYWHLANKKKL